MLPLSKNNKAINDFENSFCRFWKADELNLQKQQSKAGQEKGNVWESD